MHTYESSPSWHRYKSLLKHEFGLSIDRAPFEDRKMIRGHDVHIDEWRPSGVAKGTVILVHGGGGNGRVLAPIGDFVAGIGWLALAPDLPGYGLTRPSADFRWEYEEWPAVVASLAEITEGPVVLMGLSVGGMTAVMAALASRSVAGVVVTTMLDMGDRTSFLRAARWRWLGSLSLFGFRFLSGVMDHLALPLWLVVPMNKMSSNPAVRNYFNTDRLLGRLRVPARFFRTMHAKKLVRIELKCPLLLVHPGADLWTPTDISRSTFERVVGPKCFRELSNGTHLPLEQPAFDELKQEVTDFLGMLSASPKFLNGSEVAANESDVP